MTTARAVLYTAAAGVRRNCQHLEQTELLLCCVITAHVARAVQTSRLDRACTFNASRLTNSWRAQNCDSESRPNTHGVSNATFGLTPAPCTPCPQFHPANHPSSKSPHGSSRDSSQPTKCVTLVGCGVARLANRIASLRIHTNTGHKHANMHTQTRTPFLCALDTLGCRQLARARVWFGLNRQGSWGAAEEFHAQQDVCAACLVKDVCTQAQAPGGELARAS